MSGGTGSAHAAHARPSPFCCPIIIHQVIRKQSLVQYPIALLMITPSMNKASELPMNFATLATCLRQPMMSLNAWMGAKVARFLRHMDTRTYYFPL